MAFQPCPGIASLTVGTAAGGGGDQFQNILHFQKNDGTAWGVSEVQSLGDAFDTWIGTGPGTAAMLAHLNSGLTVTQLSVRDLSADGGPEYNKSISHAGTDTSAGIASGLSFALTLRTGFSGRSFRGRLYLYGLGQAFNAGTSSDQTTAGVVGPIVSGWENLISAAEGWSPAMKWIVLSRRHAETVDGVYTPSVLRPAGIGTPITSVGYSELVMDFQRRRAPFHGRHH